MEGAITRISEAKLFTSSTEYSQECLRRWKDKWDSGQLDDHAGKDILFAAQYKFQLMGHTPHWVFEYYAEFFFDQKEKVYTTIPECMEDVCKRFPKESQKQMTSGYFTHITNRLVAIGFIYRVKNSRGYSIFLENVLREKGVPWFRRYNQQLHDPTFRPEGGCFSTDAVDWTK